MISFGRHICNDFKVAIEKEWLLTNKKGSYASSTILMTNTRKYHGILVAKLPQFDNRLVIFPSCDEEVEIATHVYHISTHQYQKIVYPSGYYFLENFSLKDDVVTFIFLIENVRIKKEIFLLKDSNTTVVTYTLLTPDSFAKIFIKPFIAFKEANILINEIPAFYPEITKISEEKIKIAPYKNMPSAYIYNPDKGKVKLEGVWYRDFYYVREDRSGYDCVEDLYNIGIIEFELEPNVSKSIFYSTEENEVVDKNIIFERFRKQQKELIDIYIKTGACVSGDEYSSFLRHLISAADFFIMEDENKVPYIISGFLWPNYIWFRDMYASLPGIFLIPGKFKEAKKLLEETIKFEKDGLLPLNMTFNKNEIKYFSADSALWYFYALYKYLLYTDDFEIVKENSEVLKRLSFIIHKYINSTNYNIYMDKNDFLIYAGFSENPLTWMDSKLSNGMIVTPRIGKTVEINALWYNAIRIMQFISEKNKNKEWAKAYKELADNIYKSFNEKFWDDEAGCLFDFFDGDYRDKDIRLNQIFALSLPFELVDDKEKKEKIMNAVIKELYTSFGLRTLSNTNKNFKPKCEGDENLRLGAMHQGSVWPWAIGYFVNAYLRTFGRKQDSLQFIQTVFEPIFEHLKTAGLGTISEIFDGSFPYNARGRISHAWAVGEVIRSYFEDFLGNYGKPKE